MVMLLVILNFLFNGYLWTWIYLFAYLLCHLFQKTYNISWLGFYLLGYATSGILTLIGLFPPTHYLIRLFVNVRVAVTRELNLINPLLNEVLQQMLVSKKYPPRKINVLISEHQEPSAQAFGWNTIILTRGLLDTTDNEELKAVLAQAMSNLYFKASVIVQVFIVGNLATYLIMGLYTIYTKTSGFLAKFVGGRSLWPILNLLLSLLFLPIILLNLVGIRILNLSLVFLSRYYIYKADKFAIKLGYRDGLITYLEKLDLTSYTDNSLFGQIIRSYPSPMKRIDALENDL